MPVVRSLRKRLASARIRKGSVAQSRTDILAVICASPARPSAYANPGLSTPSHAKRRNSGDDRTMTRLARIEAPRATTLVASWIGSRVSGGISSTARLLATVAMPHDAAAAANDNEYR